MLPVEVLTSDACRTLPSWALRILVALAAQYRGNNGGDLAMTWSMARPFGINSKKQLIDSLAMLLERGLIEKTRQGGKKPMRPTLYNVTWVVINDLRGKIESGPTTIPSNAWAKWSSAPQGDQSAINQQHHRGTPSAPQGGQKAAFVGTTGGAPSRVWSEGTRDSRRDKSIATVPPSAPARSPIEAEEGQRSKPKPYTHRQRPPNIPEPIAQRLDKAMKLLDADSQIPVANIARMFQVTESEVLERRKLN